MEKTNIGEAFVKPRHKRIFLFDYGDEGLFPVQRLGSGELLPQTRYPRIVASVSNAPAQYGPGEPLATERRVAGRDGNGVVRPSGQPTP